MPRRYQVIFDEGAHTDLVGIQSYLSDARGEAFAESFVAKIVSFCETLRTIPHRGTQRSIDGVSLRTVNWHRSVTIAFQVNDTSHSVFVVSILYRGRDLPAALSKRLKD